MTRSRDIADQQDNLGGAVAPFVAGKNGAINGGMDIFQRGTSIAVGAARAYTADRWSAWRGGLVAGMTVSQQATSDTTNLPFIQYCSRVQRDSGNTSTQTLRFAQDFESVNSIQYNGKTVTISFYARKGANYSVAASDLRVEVLSGTGTNQQIINGYTGQTSVCDVYNTLTTTWQRFTVTGTVPSNSNQVGIVFTTGAPVGTAGAADYYEVTGVQLEIGSVATPFARAGGSIGGELALCQRYYQRLTATSTFGRFGFGMATGTTNCQVIFPLKTTMRTSVTALDFSGTTHFVMNDGVSNTATNTAPTLDSMQNPDNCLVVFTAASGLTAFRPYNIAGNNNATAYIGFSAEL